MTTAVEQQTTGALTVTTGQTEWSPQQRAGLAQLGIDQTPEADLAVFLQRCQTTGLDPFSRQIYMIGRNARKRDDRGNWHNTTQWTIQTGIDGLRVLAERHPRYAGQTPIQWCGQDGVWRDVWLSDDNPSAARVGIHRSDFAEPLYAVALFSEYAPRNRDGKLSGLWGEKGAHMIGKVAEALGLRKAFPQDMSGLYTGDEMAMRDSEEPVRYTAQRVEQTASNAEPDEAVTSEGDPETGGEQTTSQQEPVPGSSEPGRLPTGTYLQEDVDYGQAINLVEAAEDFTDLVKGTEESGVDHLVMLYRAVSARWGSDSPKAKQVFNLGKRKREEGETHADAESVAA